MPREGFWKWLHSAGGFSLRNSRLLRISNRDSTSQGQPLHFDIIPKTSFARGDLPQSTGRKGPLSALTGSQRIRLALSQALSASILRHLFPSKGRFRDYPENGFWTGTRCIRIWERQLQKRLENIFDRRATAVNQSSKSC